MTRYASVLSAAAVTVLGVASVSSAATVVLAGGDPGEGLTLNSSQVIAARNFSGSDTAQTVQGVTFPRFNASGSTGEIIRNGGVQTLFLDGTYFASTTPNDTALDAIADGVSFSPNENTSGDTVAGGVQVVTFLNLTPGTQYQVDLLQTVGTAGPRSQTVSVSGATAETVALTPNVLFNTTVLATANDMGNIVATFTPLAVDGGTGADGTVVSGAVVSAVAPIPEPTSLALLGLGGVALLRRRR